MKATIASLALACGTAVATLRDPNALTQADIQNLETTEAHVCWQGEKQNPSPEDEMSLTGLVHCQIYPSGNQQQVLGPAGIKSVCGESECVDCKKVDKGEVRYECRMKNYPKMMPGTPARTDSQWINWGVYRLCYGDDKISLTTTDPKDCMAVLNNCVTQIGNGEDPFKTVQSAIFCAEETHHSVSPQKQMQTYTRQCWKDIDQPQPGFKMMSVRDCIKGRAAVDAAVKARLAKMPKLQRWDMETRNKVEQEEYNKVFIVSGSQ